jgi:hypothetical protein
LENDLGSWSEQVEWIVQKDIKAKAEIGYDGEVVDGVFPDNSVFGIEVKDIGYIGGARKYADLPEGVKYVNEKLKPYLKKMKVRGKFSTEIREGEDGKHYFIDPTMRFPYPPSQCMLEFCDNIAECIYEGANGRLIEPIYRGKFVCEIILYSDYAKEHDYKLIVPEEIRQWVKQPYCFKSPTTGSIIVVKQEVGNTNVGSVIAYGNTIEETIELCKKRAEMITGHGLKIDTDCLDEAIVQFKKL